ncbi:MAG TPA: hypothetical protein PKA19_02415 [Bacillota bacterium]|nr:hypothetical protein [Bacillota bacterium]
MPQMNKGGKFVFGKSIVHDDLTVHFPPQAVSEYDITIDGKVILITGSKTTGGFCVTRQGLLETSQLRHVLCETSMLKDNSIPAGTFIKYKGRSYCWVEITKAGIIQLTADMLDFLQLKTGMELLSIRSSDIAFVMGAKGPLLERADQYGGELQVY